ncbi:hypothetical protein [Thauera sp.]|uniref:hypothetical protein n=1 Tax=Thauera sp. TaxID=1905334 RepID=UPI0039E4053D
MSLELGLSPLTLTPSRRLMAFDRAADRQLVDLLAGDHGNRRRRVLDHLLLAGGGDDDRAQHALFLSVDGSAARHCRDGGQDAAGKRQDGTMGMDVGGGFHGRGQLRLR